MKYNKSIKNVPLGFFKHAVFIIWSALTIYPIFFIIATALKSKEEYSFNKFGIPFEPTIDNVKNILFQTNFSRWILNSFIVTTISIAVSLILSILAAYGLSRSKFLFRNPLINIIISLIVIPPIIMILPLFVFFNQVNLTNNYIGISIIFTGILIPFCIYSLLGFFKTIPSSLIESAYIDGASSFKILIRIVIPLSGPAIATLAVVNAIYVWNDLLISIVMMSKESLRTIMGGILQFASFYDLDVPLLMTGLALTTLPIIVLYFFTQRFFIRGLTSGALKE